MNVTTGVRLGARFSWKEIMQSKASAALYARNLADKVYPISGYALGASSGVQYVVSG